MRGEGISPWRTVVQHVVVVDRQLLPARERPQGADAGDVAEHRVAHLRQASVIYTEIFFQ